jgi:hypothetical protein
MYEPSPDDPKANDSGEHRAAVHAWSATTQNTVSPVTITLMESRDAVKAARPVWRGLRHEVAYMFVVLE